MKNLAALVFSFLLTGIAANAAPDASASLTNYTYDGNAYIFVEQGVEFSVFPDGQFDFVYLGYDRSGNVNVSINTPNVSVNYNSGYNYDAYVQYDDYGAVIQIENVPVYYDQYGRIIQAGNTEIRYNDRRIVRVGGLHVYYNNYGYFSHCTGYINFWTPRYIYRPWHVYYVRPLYTHCVVYDHPYRLYYTPHRYSYHQHVTYYRNRSHVTYVNGRRDFYRPGSRIHYKDGRTAVNRSYQPNRVNTAIARSSRDRNGNGRDSNDLYTRNSLKKSNKRRTSYTLGNRPVMAENRNGDGRQVVSRGAPTDSRAKRNDRGTVTRGTPENDRVKGNTNTRNTKRAAVQERQRPSRSSQVKGNQRNTGSYGRATQTRRAATTSAKQNISRKSVNRSAQHTPTKRMAQNSRRSTSQVNRNSSVKRQTRSVQQRNTTVKRSASGRTQRATQTRGSSKRGRGQ